MIASKKLGGRAEIGGPLIEKTNFGTEHDDSVQRMHSIQLPHNRKARKLRYCRFMVGDKGQNQTRVLYVLAMSEKWP
jgi:hypothetical protein